MSINSYQAQAMLWGLPEPSKVTDLQKLQDGVKAFLMNRDDCHKYVHLLDAIDVKVTMPKEMQALVPYDANKSANAAVSKHAKSKSYRLFIHVKVHDDDGNEVRTVTFERMSQFVKFVNEAGDTAEAMLKNLQACMKTISEIARSNVDVARVHMETIKEESRKSVAERGEDGSTKETCIVIDAGDSADDNDDDMVEDKVEDKQLIMVSEKPSDKVGKYGYDVLTGRRNVDSMYASDTQTLKYVHMFEAELSAPGLLSGPNYFALVCLPGYTWAALRARRALADAFWPVMALASAVNERMHELVDVRTVMRMVMRDRKAANFKLARLEDLVEACVAVRDGTCRSSVEALCKTWAPTVVHSMYLHTHELTALAMGDIALDAKGKPRNARCHNDDGVPDEDPNKESSDCDDEDDDDIENDDDDNQLCTKGGPDKKDIMRLAYAMESMDDMDKKTKDLVHKHASTSADLKQMMRAIVEECKDDPEQMKMLGALKTKMLGAKRMLADTDTDADADAEEPKARRIDA